MTPIGFYNKTQMHFYRVAIRLLDEDEEDLYMYLSPYDIERLLGPVNYTLTNRHIEIDRLDIKTLLITMDGTFSYDEVRDNYFWIKEERIGIDKDLEELSIEELEYIKRDYQHICVYKRDMTSKLTLLKIENELMERNKNE